MKNDDIESASEHNLSGWWLQGIRRLKLEANIKKSTTLVLKWILEAAGKEIVRINLALERVVTTQEYVEMPDCGYILL